jgi:(2Fe-2S) ferredoxin
MATWNLTGMKHHLLICNGGSCMKKGGEEVTQAIRQAIAANRADAMIHTTRTRCNGRCEDACVVISYPQGIWYRGVIPDIGEQIVDHLVNGKPIPTTHISYTYEEEGLLPSADTMEGKRKL